MCHHGRGYMNSTYLNYFCVPSHLWISSHLRKVYLPVSVTCFLFSDAQFWLSRFSPEGWVLQSLGVVNGCAASSRVTVQIVQTPRTFYRFVHQPHVLARRYCFSLTSKCAQKPIWLLTFLAFFYDSLPSGIVRKESDTSPGILPTMGLPRS